MFNKFVSCIFLLGLFFTVTNLVPVSVLPFVLSAFLLPLMFLKFYNISKMAFWLAIYYLISIVSILFYSPESLFDVKFYRYDGNFLVSFLPLLIIHLFDNKFYLNIDLVVKKFIFSSVSISLVYYFIWNQENIFFAGLFESTNGFGGFLMTIGAFSYAWRSSTSRKLVPSVMLLVCVTLLILSSSRGSILGILAGIGSVLCVKNRKTWIVVLALFAIVLVQSLILVKTYPIYLQNKFIMYMGDGDVDTKTANVMIRAYENWPRGLYLFLHSPIVGTGVGSANDFPILLNDNSYFQFNESKQRFYDSAHAHNTYLHILGEQGLFGLIVFILFWYSLYRFVERRPGSEMVREGLLICFWALTFSSFTEHRIPSPSNAFAFIIILFLWASIYRPHNKLLN